MASQKRRPASQGCLKSRPAGQPVAEQAPRGLQRLALSSPRDGLLYVPDDYRSDHPIPLVLLLHGAGGTAHGSLRFLLPSLKPTGCLFLAPDSRGESWDIIKERGYGSDVAFIDRALAHVFSQYAVDQTHLAIGGFSDGASYALSLGLTNGDLFTHVLAFSPGFLAPSQLRGKPRIYVAHGIHDIVLPIDRCSRRIVSRLLQEHYEVHYREFDGPHTIPLDIVREAWGWFMGAPALAFDSSE